MDFVCPILSFMFQERASIAAETMMVVYFFEVR